MVDAVGGARFDDVVCFCSKLGLTEIVRLFGIACAHSYLDIAVGDD